MCTIGCGFVGTPVPDETCFFATTHLLEEALVDLQAIHDSRKGRRQESPVGELVLPSGRRKL